MLHGFRPDRTLKPAFAAALLAAVVTLSLAWTQAGIHVSGLFALLCPPPAPVGAALGTQASSCAPGSGALGGNLIITMVAGIFVGAGLTSLARTRGLRLAVERGRDVKASTRLALAAGGGLLVGVGAAVAGGCTSSIGLTGSALFSVAAFAFLAVFFLGGFVARVFFGRFWHV